MNRSTENERFWVWKERRPVRRSLGEGGSRLSGDSRYSLTPSRHKISRLNAESFCVGALCLSNVKTERQALLPTKVEAINWPELLAVKQERLVVCRSCPAT